MVRSIDPNEINFHVNFSLVSLFRVFSLLLAASISALFSQIMAKSGWQELVCFMEVSPQKSQFSQPVNKNFGANDSEKTEKIVEKGEMEEIIVRRRNRKKEERRLDKDEGDMKKGLNRYIEPIAQHINPPWM